MTVTDDVLPVYEESRELLLGEVIASAGTETAGGGVGV
jgi:hypothetical protein